MPDSIGNLGERLRGTALRAFVSYAAERPAVPLAEIWAEVHDVAPVIGDFERLSYADLWNAQTFWNEPDDALEDRRAVEPQPAKPVNGTPVRKRGGGSDWCEAFLQELAARGETSFATQDACAAAGAPSRSTVVRTLAKHPELTRTGAGAHTRWVLAEAKDGAA